MSSFESPDQLKKFISESSLEEFKTMFPHFSFSELAETFVLLQSQPAIESKDKLAHFFQAVDSPAMLEILGKHFSIVHFLTFLEFLDHHPSYQNRLSFVLIGLNPVIFSQSLHHLQSSHLAYLRHEGSLEPLQYHLTQFAHEGESLQERVEQQAKQFIQQLQIIETEEVTQEILKALLDQIHSLRDHLLDYLERISTALAIVWHTDRIDLIEKLSSINEGLQHQLTYLIGHPPFDHTSSTGLYFTLEERLSSIFDTALKDEDAALEGLARLSIWHLKDYWELGLLPSISHIQELDLYHHNEKERLAYHQHLSSLVQQQLERLQIGTVGSLKKAYLFSKPLLKAYIKEHQHLLLRE